MGFGFQGLNDWGEEDEENRNFFKSSKGGKVGKQKTEITKVSKKVAKKVALKKKTSTEEAWLTIIENQMKEKK